MLDRVNMALAMCLCQLRTKPATKNSSALIISVEALAAAARNKKKTNGVPNGTGWQENFYS
jgi:hypothetical protein